MGFAYSSFFVFMSNHNRVNKMNHAFNIGNTDSLLPENQHRLGDWWTYLLTEDVIVAGFDGEAGDRGERILRDRIVKGDWIFAYASGYGYVGIGLATSRETYRLLDELPPDYLTNNRHQRGIRWLYYVKSLDDAISKDVVEGYYPAQTEQVIHDIKIAEKILREFLKKNETVINLNPVTL
jgi:hypothetical protein